MYSLLVKRDKCQNCGHPKDDHSVYRPICLTNGCDCDRPGGLDEPTGRDARRDRNLKAVAEKLGTIGTKA